MANLVVIGSQWGDEGKGKIVDILARDANLIVRFQGGSNAGHTVVTKKDTYVFHLIPSGILNRGKLCVLGNGVVIDPAAFLEELQTLKNQGVKIAKNLVISQRAHVILPYHKAIDRASEKAKGANQIGTTGKGIGPAYVDKMARIGIRMGDLLDPVIFRQKVKENLVSINTLLRQVYHTKGFSVDAICRTYAPYADALRPFVADDSVLIHTAMEQGRTVLFEGAQGTHLDVDLGTYPYVTSSSSCAGGACIGAGVGPTMIDGVLGVTKAYSTRVGSGPFPTELSDTTGQELQERGNEFGSTTGRARRCGWLDAVVLRYASRVNGFSSLAVTKLDVLDGCPSVKICMGYRYKGKLYKDMPASLQILTECEPMYDVMPGWMTPTTDITSFKDLPPAAKQYLQRIGELAGCPIDIISTGSRREQTIIVRNPLTQGKPRIHRPSIQHAS